MPRIEGLIFVLSVFFAGLRNLGVPLFILLLVQDIRTAPKIGDEMSAHTRACVCCSHLKELIVTF